MLLFLLAVHKNLKLVRSYITHSWVPEETRFLEGKFLERRRGGDHLQRSRDYRIELLDEARSNKP